MAQLKMYWFPGTPIEKFELPEGYSFSNYKDEKDVDAWIRICQNGLVSDNYDEALEGWKSAILGRPDINLSEDVFFIDNNKSSPSTPSYLFTSKQLGILSSNEVVPASYSMHP